MPKWLQYYIGGGMPKWLQYYIGGGSLGTPKSDYVICARPLMTINKCAMYFSQNISIRVILQDCVQKMLDLLNDAHFFRGTHIMARLWIIHVQLPQEN